MGRMANRDLHWIFTGEAGVAVAVPIAIVEERIEPFPTQVRKGVGGDMLPDLFDRLMRGQQFFASWGVDSVEAGVGCRWCGDTHMHLARSRLPQHGNHFPQGSATYERIFNQYDALTAQQADNGIEF